jgi:hypothetical protein
MVNTEIAFNLPKTVPNMVNNQIIITPFRGNLCVFMYCAQPAAVLRFPGISLKKSSVITAYQALRSHLAGEL